MYCDECHQIIFEVCESLKLSESLKYLDIKLRSYMMEKLIASISFLPST